MIVESLISDLCIISKHVLRIVIGGALTLTLNIGETGLMEDFISQQIQEINSQVAQYRDLLINIGQPRDCPELREKIRRLRRNCVETCRHTSQLILPQVRRYGANILLRFFPSFSSFFPPISFPKWKKEKQREKIFLPSLTRYFKSSV